MPEQDSATPYDAVTEEWLLRHLDEEEGSVWDWSTFSERFFDLDEPNTVIDYPERTWVAKVESMLDKGGAPNKVYLALTLPLRQAHVALEQPEDDESGEITEFIESALLKPYQRGGLQTPLREILGQMSHAVAVKRMYFEKVFTRRDDGKIVYSKVMWRPPEACELKRDKRTGDIEGFRQFVGSFQRDDADREGYVSIPAERTFVYIHGQHRNPYYGSSDLEATFWLYELKMKVLTLWHLFLDRSAVGKIIAYGETPDEANKRAKRFSSLRSSGVIGIPSSSPEERIFEQISPDNTANATFKEMITYLDAEMTGSIMANWADLASSAASGKGSYALSQDQSSLFLKSRESVAAEMAHAITAHLIAPLVAVNFGPDKPVPKLRLEKMDDSQTEVTRDILTTLGSSTTLNIPEEFIHLLMERLSLYLELDQEKVRTMIDEEQERLEQQREMAEKAAETQQAMSEQGLADQQAGQGREQAASDARSKGSGQQSPAQQQQQRAAAATNVAARAVQQKGTA